MTEKSILSPVDKKDILAMKVAYALLNSSKVQNKDIPFILKMMSDLLSIHKKLIESIEKIEQIAKEKKGDDGHTPTHEEIIDIITPLIPKVRDGIDGHTYTEEDLITIIKPLIPKIDEKYLIEKIVKKIKIPKNDIDYNKVIDIVLNMPEGKKLSSKHIDGLEQTLSAFRSQLARGYLHGGGDTVKAGSNVTIVRNTDGSKTISSSGGGGTFGGSQEKSTTVPDGSTTTFSFDHTPKIIIWNGAIQTLTDDYTVSGSSITFTASAGIPLTNDKIINAY